MLNAPSLGAIAESIVGRRMQTAMRLRSSRTIWQLCQGAIATQTQQRDTTTTPRCTLSATGAYLLCSSLRLCRAERRAKEAWCGSSSSFLAPLHTLFSASFPLHISYRKSVNPPLLALFSTSTKQKCNFYTIFHQKSYNFASNMKISSHREPAKRRCFAALKAPYRKQ